MIVLRGNGKHFSAGHDIKAANLANAGNGRSYTVSDIYEAESRRYLG